MTTFCPTCVKTHSKLLLSALNARNQHDINKFNYSLLNLYDKNQMISLWLQYIEEIVLKKEGINSSDISFSKAYLQNTTIQNKYLEVNNFLAIPISNSIRLLPNYKALISLNIKMYKMGISWRHLILIVISQLFKEQTEDRPTYVETKES